ncbi:MAG: DUF2817 domain-containing protein [Phycisphaeraceae bacterium]|nr:MAG: DUF2817 domain-containing protein [Phycisphaeraceae bacterium]
MLLADHAAEHPEADALIAETAEVLLDHGASVNHVDHAGRSALTYALEWGWEQTAKALEECGGISLGGFRDEPEITRSSYRTYAQIEQFLTDMHAMYPALTERSVLGTSVLGRNISAIRISSDVGVPADKPQVRYISTMHGDETVGNEMCLFLIEHLLSNYGSDPRITSMVDGLDIWIVPLMNPDGYVALTRSNANGVDLNRNFPDPYTSPNNSTAGRQPETAVIMNWSWAHNFVLSANIHTGALVVNYPFDNNPSGSSIYTPTPDDDVMVALSLSYSEQNLPMYNNPSFPQGITNGADWYSISGGMQDWNYHYNNCMEVTLELSNVKNPPASTIPGFWNDNRESMLAYLEGALMGVRGIITDAVSDAPLAAAVDVLGRDFTVKAGTDVGNYHRILLPGSYDLQFSSPGYDTLTVPGVAVSTGDATRVDVALGAPPELLTPNGGEMLSQGVASEILWTGPSHAAYELEWTQDADALQATNHGFEDGVIPPVYSFAGNAGWITTTATANSGSHSARAGVITHNQSSTLIRTIEGPADISFAYRVSSEANYDFFRFSVGGTTLLSRSGNVAWTSFSTSVGPGTHELRWSYTKDFSVSVGSDTAWIDDVVIVSGSTDWEPLGQTAVGAQSFSWSPSGTSENAKIRFRALYPNDGYGGWVESADAFSIVPAPDCPGDINGDFVVDLNDFVILAGNFGTTAGATLSQGDLNGDGAVDLNDFVILAGNFGTVCVSD